MKTVHQQMAPFRHEFFAIAIKAEGDGKAVSGAFTDFPDGTAKKNYAEHGVVDYIPTISTEDSTAAMYGPYDYYLNPERGAIAQWSSDKFAVMSWEDWLTADPMSTAKNLQKPTLMIHSDGAVLPQYTKNDYEQIAAEDKKLHWMETELESPYHQFSYYDQDAEVDEAVSEATEWFRTKM